MPPLNTPQALTHRKVRDYLTTSALFKDQMQVSEDEPTFFLTYGSAKVEIEVLAWEVHPWETRELAIVRACSCVTVETEITPELMRYLLTENSRMRFGAFHLGDGGEVRFSDSVLGGENMDLMELQTCILSVVTIADTYAAWIAEQFGGKQAVNLDTSVYPHDRSSNSLSNTFPEH